ncbi:MAG: peptide/nickel transport system substrate-binding protein [Pseudonocardiales bacterium]|jgi:peptide/nickel transport system substrate-binding protein|nr:peptide/nickel transport system substrate-binding protein [Pseudonocardiales bacterium]
MAFSSRGSKALTLSVAVLTAVSLAACGSAKKTNGSSSGAGTSGKPITIGTTDQVTALDPAGSYDNGSLLLEDNLYQFLMSVPAGKTAPEPDAAQKCSFTSPTEYTCTLKPNLKFSNGDPLTAEDVVFSFNRVVKINNANGPVSLIGNMASVTAQGTDTVVFKLKNPNDQTWPFILGTSAGPIVDHKVFPADKLLADDKIVGSGPFELGSYQKNQLVQLKANPNYTGPNTAKTSDITLKYYTQSSNLKLDVQSGAIDIAWRSLTPTDVDSLSKDSNVKVLTGAGGELRYLVFNFKTMPGKNDAQKLAIRQAIAYSVDRNDLATNVYKGTYQPAYSQIPQGVADATTPFKDAYGEKPNKAKAQSTLSAAGVTTPVTLNIDYTTDHYGPTSADEYNQIKRQLENTGLFKVNLKGTAYTTYSPERVKDTYSIYQLGWFPDFVDGDNYLGPFLTENNFVHAHYCDPGAKNRPCDTDKVLPLLTTEETQSGAARTAAFAQIQKILATGTMPLLPLLSGKQVAVTGKGISGVEDTLDPTYQFRMWLFSKS